MRSQQLRLHMWAVLAATALTIGVTVEASAQFSMRGGPRMGPMRGGPGPMKPVAVKPPTIKVPGHRGPVTGGVSPGMERMPGGRHRGPMITHRPPRFPHIPVVIGPGFVRPPTVIVDPREGPPG